jgi:ribosomal protein S4E
MRALYYTVNIYESSMDIIHGYSIPIKEFYIPEKKLYFNLHNGLNVFQCDEFRIKDGETYIEVDLDEQIVKDLMSYQTHREALVSAIKIIQAGLK